MEGYLLQIAHKDSSEDSFAAVYHTLKSQCLANAIWFAWRETEITLPRGLTINNERDALSLRWDVARIFTDGAELRAQRRGSSRLTLILTENDKVLQQLEQEFKTARWQFDAKNGNRILAGKKPLNPISSNPDALIEVAFPRELDYDVGSVPHGQMLVADVRCYYDNVRRLKFVRYCSIHPRPIRQSE